ncbi:MAG: hypothetical protein MI919_06470, partial [Holophagales bacterium]|nr:hypothetical protein [Holophagales bacterium]
MSIVPLRKVTLFGSSTDIRQTLRGLQDLGCMHLVPLDAAAPIASGEPAPSSREARKALRFLIGAPVQRRQAEDDEGFDFDAVVAQALEVRRRRRSTQARIDGLQARIR